MGIMSNLWGLDPYIHMIKLAILEAEYWLFIGFLCKYFSSTCGNRLGYVVIK